MPFLWLIPRSKEGKHLAAIAILLLLLIAAGIKIVQLSAAPKIVERVVVETKIVEKRVAGPVIVRERIVTQPGGERIVERTIERAAVTTEKGTEIDKQSERTVTPPHVALWNGTASFNPSDINKPSLGLSRSFGIITVGYSHDVGQGMKLNDGHHINLGIPLF